MKSLSLAGLLLMVLGLVGLLYRGALVSPAPLAIGAQVTALALMMWARVTFGMRSFHAAANPTAGGLVTTGPYRFVRHPIYAAVCLFAWAGVLAHWSLVAAAFGLLILAGAFMRMLAEERLVTAQYPEYQDYARVTKRLMPYIF
jgi:protein-S-isoprenylcysteine O-methyltransferase Ste14